MTDRECVLATIIGMPGVGKSRLVYELIESVLDRATVLRGRCLPYGEGITFWPIAEVVRQVAAISEGDSVDEARSRIEALLPESEERAVIRDHLAAAVGLGGSAGGSTRPSGRSAGCSSRSQSIARSSWSSTTSIGPSRASLI